MPSFATTELRTDRLLLRPLRPGDDQALFEIHSDPQVVRYLSFRAWTSIDQAREKIANNTSALLAGEYLTLGLERLDDHRLIGVCTLYSFNHQCRRAEVGYIMGRDAWGLGLMREALTALLDYAFNELDLIRVEADIDPRNEASARILERLGFQREGLLRERWIVEGEVSDTGLYGLLKREWTSAKMRG